MAYEHHPKLKTPPHRDAHIWRYIDFTKLISMLSSGSLFFASLATLAQFDKYEGQLTWPGSTSPAAPPGFKTAEELASIGLYGDKLLRMINQEIAKGHVSTNSFFELPFINCWHMNDDESDAMWKIYSRDSNGVAILSSFNRLSASFRDAPHQIFIGEVEYRDYTTTVIDCSNVFFRYMSKRSSFSHERELRAIWMIGHPAQRALVATDDTDIEGVGGFAIPVDLDVLIESIVVNPQSASWFIDLVRSVCKKWELDVPVVVSDMSQEPPVPPP